MQVVASNPEAVSTSQQEPDCEAEGCSLDEAADLNIHEPVNIEFEEEVKALGRSDHEPHEGTWTRMLPVHEMIWDRADAVDAPFI